jgi:hypothetical protein
MERSRKGNFNLNNEPPIPYPKNRQEMEEQIILMLPKLHKEVLLSYAIAAVSENLYHMNTLQIAFMWNTMVQNKNIQERESVN